MQKQLAALALVVVFVLAFGFPVGVIAQGEFDTASASGGAGSAVSGPVSGGGGGGGASMPIAPTTSSSGGGIGGGFIQPQQVAPSSSGGGFGQSEPVIVNDFNFQTRGAGQQQQAGAENVCAIRDGGNDVSCFLARESQNLPIGKGPCQPWESDCHMQNNWQMEAKVAQVSVATSNTGGSSGYCGDGFCTDAEFQANNCCEDCNPGPGCGVGPQGKAMTRPQQPIAKPLPYKPPPSPTLSLPTQAFGMPSGGMLVGQFSPAMIRPEGISREELLLQKYKRYIERYLSSDDAEQYCNDIPSLVEKATATLKEKAPQLLDITNMCNTTKKQADKCKKFAPQICEQMKKQSGCDENALDKCKTEMKKYLGQFSDPKQVQLQCEQKWNNRAMSCKSSVQSASCDRSQFIGDCTKRFMAGCRGQPQQPPQQPPQQQQPPARVCAQVITPAISPSGYCKEFPTPCDVPGDWKRVDSCKNVPPVVTSTPPTACIEVITPAISPDGYSCKNFATPCEVPSDWKKVTACPVATSTPAATTTAAATVVTPAPTTTAIPNVPTATATATQTATAPPTETVTVTVTAVATQTATMPAGGMLTSLFAQAGMAEEGCSLRDAEAACSGKWDEQSKYMNCGGVQDSCDMEKFMSECQNSINQGTGQMLKDMDRQCNERYENEKLKIEMMCSEMEDRIDQCNEQSKLACDDLDEEYESCIALAPKKQEKLREAVQNIARDMCQFSKYKPKFIKQNIEDLSPSATVPVTFAVKSKLSDDQISQLKGVVLGFGEPNQIGKLVIYKAKMKAENFNDLKKLGFVLDAQLDSIQRSVEMSATSMPANLTKSDTMPDVPTSIATLEAVKDSVSEDFKPLVSDTEGKIADSADSVKKVQDEMNSRGLVYKLKWFLGMGAESERADSEKLSAEAKNLATTEESLKKIAEQISDLSTKAALLEQANDIGKRKDALGKMSSDKKNNAAGMLSFLKMFGG